ncbi:hypothetical protein QDR37_11770 [Amnibacterium sp. CER49]|jgi:predicted RNA-binding Zn-ribbon protein involved in translation (DUF1610 family)|nr:hypothetical protein [Amnibacterium sp. CER49]MDH2444624.1 hypothetical protein [Amnibacterium sp. CER49]
MYENELTQGFCITCYESLVLRGDSGERHWECPGCGRVLSYA